MAHVLDEYNLDSPDTAFNSALESEGKSDNRKGFFVGDCFDLFVLTDIQFFLVGQGLESVYGTTVTDSNFDIGGGSISGMMANQKSLNAFRNYEKNVGTRPSDLNPNNLAIWIDKGDAAWNSATNTFAEWVKKYAVMSFIATCALSIGLLLTVLPVVSLFSILLGVEVLVNWLKLIAVIYVAWFIATLFLILGGLILEELSYAAAVGNMGFANDNTGTMFLFNATYVVMLSLIVVAEIVFAKVFIFDDTMSLSKLENGMPQGSGALKIGGVIASVGASIYGGAKMLGLASGIARKNNPGNAPGKPPRNNNTGDDGGSGTRPMNLSKSLTGRNTSFESKTKQQRSSSRPLSPKSTFVSSYGGGKPFSSPRKDSGNNKDTPKNPRPSIDKPAL